MDWFSVDKEGLARLLERKGKAHAVLELIQNAWDEEGVTKVEVTLADHPMRGRSRLVVEDDAPDGFADLTHAFTVFAPSKKVSDATKRGRFNLGEKLVLAICDSATVTSTRGGYTFDEEGRTKHRTKRSRGTRFEAIIRLTQVEREQVGRLIQTLLLPVNAPTTVFNGQTLYRRLPVRSFTATLATEIADLDGILRMTRRKTEVRLFEPMGDEVPMLYEMGIPVVEHGGRWHIDIGQKVPLTFERDNVTPAYLRSLRVEVLNHTADLLVNDDATSGWVKQAAGSPDAEETAVGTVMRLRFGDKAVAYDPSDPEANKTAMSKGYTVVHGGTLSQSEWAQVKRAGVLRPAGHVTPTRFAEFGADGKPPIDPVNYTVAQARVVAYAKALAKDLLGRDIAVAIYNVTSGWGACWGEEGRLSLNLMRLGHRWFSTPDEHAIDALLLHEFAHSIEGDHLSHKFHEAICTLGARLRDSQVRLERES